MWPSTRSWELDQDGTATLTPASPMASATLRLFNPQGSLVETVVATLDTAGPAAVVSVVDPGTVTRGPMIVVDDATGLAVGGAYAVTSQNGWTARVLISEIAGTTVTLATAPPGELAAGDTINGLVFTAQVPGSTLTPISLFWRLEWDMLDAAGDRHRARQVSHVVRSPWAHTVDVEMVSRYVSRAWPSVAIGADYGYFADLAVRAETRLHRSLTAIKAYPHTVVDRDALTGAALAALRWELALEGYVSAGWDPMEFERAQRDELKRTTSEALSGQWVDRDDEGVVDESNVRGVFSMPLVRR